MYGRIMRYDDDVPLVTNGLTEHNDNLALADVTQIRKEFPETWLWSDAVSGYLIVLYTFQSLWSGVGHVNCSCLGSISLYS